MKKNTIATIGIIVSTILASLITMFGYKMFKMTVGIVNTPWLNKTLGILFIFMAAVQVIVNLIHAALMVLRK